MLEGLLAASTHGANVVLRIVAERKASQVERALVIFEIGIFLLATAFVVRI